MLLLAVLSAGLGVLAMPFAHFLGASYGAPQAEAEFHTRLVPFLATFAGLLGFGWAFLVYYQKAISANLLMRRFSLIYTLLKNKYYVDELYMLLVRNVMFVISRALAWFDRNVVDGAVNGIGWICKVSGDGLSRLQFGRLQAYLMMFVAGLVVIAVFMLSVNPSVLALAR